MTMKAEIKRSLIASLEACLDPYMLENGFLRGKASLIYVRNIRGSTQKIDLSIQIYPKDNLNASAAIYPQMEVLVPEVDMVLDAMIGDNLGLLEGVTGGTSKQPIGVTSEKAHAGRWFVYQSDSVQGLVDEIKVFIKHWTMPFLDGYATPENILATDQRNDGRLLRDRAQMMRVVAAALACDRRDYAQELMEKWLGTLGVRRRYEQVYKYIQKH